MRTPLVSSCSLLLAVSSFLRQRVLGRVGGRAFAVALGGGLLAAALAVACSTTDGGGSEQIVSCREVFTGCPLDPIPSVAQTEDCTVLLDGPCGNAGLVYRSCVTGACTDAGLTDYAAIVGRCYASQVSFQTCLDSLDAGMTTASSSGAGDTTPDSSTPAPAPAPTTTTPAPTATPDAAAPIDASAAADATAPADAGADGAI